MPNSKLYVEDTNDNGAVWVTFIGTTDEVIIFNSKGNKAIEDGKAVLRAASDHLRHRRYDGDGTKAGLHVKTGKSMAQTTEPELATVSIGTEVDFEMPLKAKDAPELWVRLGKLNNRHRVTRVETEWREITATKHDMVDLFIQGYTLRVKVAPFRPYWDVIKAQFDEPDNAKAFELRRQALARKDEYEKDRRPLMAEAKAEANEDDVVGADDTESIMIRVVGKKNRIDVRKLPVESYALNSAPDKDEPNGYPVYAQSWNPTSDQAVKTWRKIAARGYQINI